ncbi:hypothetical protein GW17_00012367 [Ensete ventricosum]|nr:hypothetical protein GW17_00012367 [Ensete ventricosum]RZR94005.1 hypothetical protein BHM03_00022616 [Ensete ventricosum]
MLLYLPVRRYVLRKDFHSRKLYVTPNAIVYKVLRPVPFPCFGVLKKEKHVLLASVADIVIEQGYLQSFFGIYSVRIHNEGVRRTANDDFQIQGVSDSRAFRKAVLMHLSNIRSDGFNRQTSVNEDPQTFGSCPPSGSWVCSCLFMHAAFHNIFALWSRYHLKQLTHVQILFCPVESD